MKIGKQAMRVMQGPSDYSGSGVTVSIRLHKNDLKLIDAVAGRIGMSRSRFIANCLRQHLRHEHKVTLKDVLDDDQGI